MGMRNGILRGGSSRPLFPGRFEIWNVGFYWGRKTGGPGENPWSWDKDKDKDKDKNRRQNYPTCEARSGSQTRTIAVEGKRSQHCTIPIPRIFHCYLE